MVLNLTVVVQILMYRQATQDALAKGGGAGSSTEGDRRQSARLRAKKAD